MPVVAKSIKVEAGWASFSTLIIVSVPMLIWKYIEAHPAVRMVGITKSPNTLVPAAEEQVEAPRTEPSSLTSALDEMQEEAFENGVSSIKRWFTELDIFK